jgi:chromosome segregation ATPase
MFTRIKNMIDDIEGQLKEAKREREEYKASWRQAAAENAALTQQITELNAHVAQLQSHNQ